MNGLQQFMKASRARVLPVIWLPILLGSAASYVWYDAFELTYLAACLIGGTAVHLFSNMINDWWDFRNGVDTRASETDGVVMTNSSFLVKGIWSTRLFGCITWTLFAAALACGVYLAVVVGLPVFIYVAAGAFLAYFYVAPPFKFGYQGKGYSEISILIAFGVLPVTGAIFVHAETLDIRAFLLACPIGLMTTLILFNHHFLHWKSDASAGKRTLVVVLGEGKALQFSKMLLLLVFIFTILCVAGNALPWYSLAALVACRPVMKAYRAIQSGDRMPQSYLSLMAASGKGTSAFGVILLLSLIVQAVVL